MKPILTLLLLLATSSAFAVEQRYETTVQSLIDLFKSHDKEKIAERVAYPLGREAPIAAIDNKQEMLRRFDQVFDVELSRIIAESTTDDWEQVGWRGIMLNNGTVWMDTDGDIIGVNYQSAAEKALRQQLIAADKARLHESLRQYVNPVLEWRTPRFHIRIDDLGDGNYRYAAWSKNRSASEKPDIVLTGGRLQADGSGGNHSFTFTNGRYKYICYVSVIGTAETPPGDLEVYRGDQLILHEKVIEVLGD